MVAKKVRQGGVYRITNVRNGKIYIGSAVRFDKRWYEHQRLLNAGQHKNRHLQAAWIKYGPDAFTFDVLEEMELHGTTEEIKAALVAAEQKYIDALNACDNSIGYNINIIATSRLGVKASAETRARIGDSKKGTAFRLGIPHTEETKELIRQALTGRTWTPEARANFSASRKGKNHSDHQVAMVTAALRKKFGSDEKSNVKSQKRARVWQEDEKRAQSAKLIGIKDSEDARATKSLSRTAKASGDPFWFMRATYATPRSAAQAARIGGYSRKLIEVERVSNGRFAVLWKRYDAAALVGVFYASENSARGAVRRRKIDRRSVLYVEVADGCWEVRPKIGITSEPHFVAPPPDLLVKAPKQRKPYKPRSEDHSRKLGDAVRRSASRRHMSVFDKTFGRNCHAWRYARKEGWSPANVGVLQNPDGRWVVRLLSSHRAEIEADLQRRRSENGARHSEILQAKKSNPLDKNCCDEPTQASLFNVEDAAD